MRIKYLEFCSSILHIVYTNVYFDPSNNIFKSVQACAVFDVSCRTSKMVFISLVEYNLDWNQW